MVHGGFDIQIREKKWIILLVILYLFPQVLLIVKQQRTNLSSESIIKINFLTNLKQRCPSCRDL